jgi:hypothetical protein
MKDPSKKRKMEDAKENELLMAALKSGCEPNFNLVIRSANGKFDTRYRPQPELVRLMQANQERLIALLEKNMLAVDWGVDATFATFRAIPVSNAPAAFVRHLDCDSGKTFETFTLPIPPDKPYAILQ